MATACDFLFLARCCVSGANEVGSTFLAGKDDQESRGLVTQIAAVVPGVGHLGEALTSLESVRPMALHLDGERTLEHVDENGYGMHVAPNLATRRHLGDHGDQLVLALREPDGLPAKCRRRLKNGRELESDGTLLLRLRGQCRGVAERESGDE